MLPQNIFRKIDSLFRDLILKGRPSLGLRSNWRHYKFQSMVDGGGLAVPNAELYFLSSQAQNFTRWGEQALPRTPYKGCCYPNYHKIHWSVYWRPDFFYFITILHLFADP